MSNKKFLGSEKTFSLRRHLMLTSWAIILLGVFLSIGVVTQFVYRTEQAVWDSLLVDAARNASRTVAEFIYQVQEYAGVIALLDAEILTSDPQLIVDLLDQNQALLEMVRVNQDGQIIAGAFQGGIDPILPEFFESAQADLDLLIDKNESYVGDVQISADGNPYIILTVPVQTGGVVAVRLSMNVLWDVVSAIRVGESGVVYVVDRSGYILAHPDPAVVLAGTNINDYPDMGAILIEPNQPWQGNYLSFTGYAVIGTSMPISNSNWMVFAEVERHEAFATTRNAIFMLGGGVLLAGTVVSIALALLMQYQVIKPVQQLRDDVVRFGEGDLDYRITEPPANEIGTVAMAFNEMAARLQEREAAFTQARDEAIAASRFKSRLLANISHDLMTPLNIILGYADMLREGVHGPLSERQQGIMERVFANSQRLISLIRSLLDQAQIEAGRIRFSYQPFMVEDLLQSVASVMGVLAQRKKLTFTTETAPDFPERITGDFQRVQQILMNLVGNAVKFTDQGSIQIRLYLYDDHVSWCMEITDTGRGIPEEALQTIFDPFQRVDSSTTRDTEGIGLGLSIVNQLTNMMGGKIKVRSEVDVGSTFYVILPLQPQGEEDDATLSDHN